MKFKQNLVEDTIGDAVQKAEQNLEMVGSDDVDIVSKEGDIEDALEKAYKVNRQVNKRGRGQFVSILLIGHAGVGKTQRVKSWCKKHNLHLIQKNAQTEDIGNLAGIFAPNEDKTKALNLPTGAYDELDKEDVALFLDEFNRASSQVRFTLAQLINEHKIPNSMESGGYHYFTNIQLVVAAINPAEYGKYNTDELDVAEMDRFYSVWVKPSKYHTLEYLKEKYDEEIAYDLEHGDEEAYKEDLGRKNLAITLLTSKYFEFDDDEEIEKSAEDKTHILSPRGLEEVIQICDGTKDSLLKEWNNLCNPRKKDMVERILANYKDVDDKANSVFKGNPFKQNGTDNWKKIRNGLDQI